MSYKPEDLYPWPDERYRPGDEPTGPFDAANDPDSYQGYFPSSNLEEVHKATLEGDQEPEKSSESPDKRLLAAVIIVALVLLLAIGFLVKTLNNRDGGSEAPQAPAATVPTAAPTVPQPTSNTDPPSIPSQTSSSQKTTSSTSEPPAPTTTIIREHTTTVVKEYKTVTYTPTLPPVTTSLHESTPPVGPTPTPEPEPTGTPVPSSDIKN